MPALQLFIGDEALATALMEQMQSGAYGEAESGKDLPAALQSPDTSLVIIDEAAADRESLKILADAQARGLKKRVLFLGPMPSDGLPEGTEHMPFPIRLGALLARLHFYLQAAPRLGHAAIIFGPYRFEPNNRQLVEQASGAITRLTEKETALLDLLLQGEAPLTREELLARVWGYGAQVDTHTLETHIYQLRRKLDPQGAGFDWLVNEQGIYRFNRDAAL